MQEAIISLIKKMPRANEAIHLARRCLRLAGHNPVRRRLAALWRSRLAAAGKKRYEERAARELRAFLASDCRLDFSQTQAPVVDIVLVLFNQAAMTHACLRSLKDCTTPFRLILFDNHSTDETARLLTRLDGVTVIGHDANIGFLRAVNRAAREARSPAILLLNNDTTVPPAAIGNALATLHASPDHGVVGGKLILPGGRLQEAGSIIWRNGACLGYGRGGDPEAGEYCFRREVDYCSGAFLLVRRELFIALGGFDESYAPAYYEESDFCVRARQAGYKVIYEPTAEIHHFEFASSGSLARAVAQQKKNRAVFVDKHRDFLAAKPENAPENILAARMVARFRGRVLVIDDRVPHTHLGGGFPRARDLVRAIAAAGYFVTFYPLRFPADDWDAVYDTLPPDVEVMLGHGMGGLKDFLRCRQGYYDHILVSRPRNMTEVGILYRQERALFAGARIIYDAEALFALRAIGQARIENRSVPPEKQREMLRQEAALAAPADLIVSVSEAEAERFRRHTGKETVVIGHSLEPQEGGLPFAERRGLLFVGSMSDERSPNTDSIIWFMEEVMPLIDAAPGPPISLIAVGNHQARRLRPLAAKPQIKFTGPLADEDLTRSYHQCRVFIAPTRFAAGIPHKIHQAAAMGIPVVATSILAEQLGWRHGHELLVADAAEDFAAQCRRLHDDRGLWEELRTNAGERVRRDCSPARFHQAVAELFPVREKGA